MKARDLLSSVIFLIVLLPAQADDAADELKKMQGTWLVISSQEGGKEQAEEATKKLKIVIKEDVFSFQIEGQSKSLNMKLKLDPSTQPKSVDFASTIREGRISKGIYELASDELKICWSRNGKLRPDGFSTTSGDDRIFLTLTPKK